MLRFRRPLSLEKFKAKSNPLQHDKDALECLRRAHLQQSRLRTGRLSPGTLPPSPDSIFWRISHWIRTFFLRIFFRNVSDPHFRPDQTRELENEGHERKLAFFSSRAKEMEAELGKMLVVHENLIRENVELRQRVQDLGSRLGKSEETLQFFQLEQDAVYQRLHNEIRRLNAECAEKQRSIAELEQKVQLS